MSAETGAGPTLRRATLTAASGNVVGAVAKALLTFAGGIFFARSLGPAAMGDFALAASIVSVAQLLIEVGLGPALVHRATVTDADVRFVFTASTALGLAACGLCIGIAHIAAMVTDMPGAVAPALVMSFGLVALGLSHAATALVRRRLRFAALQAVTAGGYLAGLVVAGVPIALVGGGALAPAAAVLVQHVVLATWALAVTRHAARPTLRPTDGLMRFGFVATLANVAFLALLNLDTFVVAARFDAADLGLYSRAFFLAYAPVASVVLAVQGVLFSAASRRRDSTAASRAGYLVTLNLTALTLFPLYAGLVAAPAPVVVALYGPEWTAAAEVLRVLALGMPFMTMGSAATAALWARGRVVADLSVTATVALALLVAFLVIDPGTLTAVAAMVGGAYAARWALQAVACGRDLRVSIGGIAEAVLPGVVLSAAVGIAVLVTAELTRDRAPAVALMAVTAAGTAAWLLVSIVAWHRTLVPDARRLIGEMRAGRAGGG
ncbi:MAG: oligosaccharide flippase family protein [Actinomycetes bacterium]